MDRSDRFRSDTMVGIAVEQPDDGEVWFASRDEAEADTLKVIRSHAVDFEEFGLVVVNIEYDDAQRPGGYLDEVVAVPVRGSGRSISDGLNRLTRHLGHVIYLVGSDNAADAGRRNERVMRGSKVLAVYTRDGSTGPITRRILLRK